MCGIIGVISDSEATPILLEGLRRLEYRGYDSAGIATITGGAIARRRAKGKVAALGKILESDPVPGGTGIGHTRWATHGVPNEVNAHPHATARVALVHNGIIENFLDLREELVGNGAILESDTDTEIIVHLIDRELDQGKAPAEAVAAVLPRLEGAFALVCIFAGEEDLMIGARRGSPLAIGFANGTVCFGSDALALASLAREICYLEEGDWAVVSRNEATVRDASSAEVLRERLPMRVSGAAIGKGNYQHFMLKEICEQPAVIGDTLHSMLNQASRTITLPPLDIPLEKVRSISISACGTAFYAGLIGRYWIEDLARIPVSIDIASEFRYRSPPLAKDGLAIFVSQSGETMDTLEALRYARRQGQRVLSIVNAPESSIARESDAVLPTLAGPEIGVASTKAFTTQLTVFACLAMALARSQGTVGDEREAALVEALLEIPTGAAELLECEPQVAELAHLVAKARDVLYLGRGTGYPIALEGALKLKELSYIHAEAYAAGEMKHGPIALIDEEVPVIAIAPSTDPLFAKTAANLQEVSARGGRVLLISDVAGIDQMRRQADLEAVLEMPTVNPFVAPILYAVPVQLLAYHAALAKGTDVDQPRNLAKSVTVE